MLLKSVFGYSAKKAQKLRVKWRVCVCVISLSWAAPGRWWELCLSDVLSPPSANQNPGLAHCSLWSPDTHHTHTPYTFITHWLSFIIVCKIFSYGFLLKESVSAPPGGVLRSKQITYMCWVKEHHSTCSRPESDLTDWKTPWVTCLMF